MSLTPEQMTSWELVEVVKSQADEIASLRAKMEKATEALKPFADAWENALRQKYDKDDAAVDVHFRRAAATLKEIQEL
jgi:hypothetical protein